MDDVFNKLIKAGLTPNAFYVLYCSKHKRVPNAFVSYGLESRKLQVEKWLDQDLQLTQKSVNFIQEIDAFFKKSKKKTSQILMGESFLDLIQEYVEIFPNKRLASGKPARVNVKTLENSFRWFFDTYQYDWDIILEATRKYVYDFELKNYEFMRTSQYFVRKQNTDKSWDSDLATYCDMIINGEDDFEDNHFKEKVV
jgi:hypothetical protein